MQQFNFSRPGFGRKAPRFRFEFGVDFWVDFFLLFFPRRKAPKKSTRIPRNIHLEIGSEKLFSDFCRIGRKHPSRDVIFSGKKNWLKHAKNYHITWCPWAFKTRTFGITWCDNFWPNFGLKVAEDFHIRWRTLAAHRSLFLRKFWLEIQTEGS